MTVVLMRRAEFWLRTKRRATWNVSVCTGDASAMKALLAAAAIAYGHTTMRAPDLV